MPDGADGALTPAEHERLEAIRSADSLADLARAMDTDDEHAAYFEARRAWRDLRGRELAGSPPADGLPGTSVDVSGRTFHVHGITHADTAEERAFLREHVDGYLDAGHAVYCEQGVRPMYFDDRPAVCEMDDYLWARERCRVLDLEDSVFAEPAFDGLRERLDALAARFREATYGLIESAGDTEAVRQALGDVASAFLMSHEDLATGDDFEAYVATRRAARDPAALAELQAYYERTFLPQPLEREWLRRHDPELEIVTHARNERMADYARYHADGAADVHVIVGAAHQPGVVYYLREHRDGRRSLDGFEPVG